MLHIHHRSRGQVRLHVFGHTQTPPHPNSSYIVEGITAHAVVNFRCLYRYAGDVAKAFEEQGKKEAPADVLALWKEYVALVIHFSAASPTLDRRFHQYHLSSRRVYALVDTRRNERQPEKSSCSRTLALVDLASNSTKAKQRRMRRSRSVHTTVSRFLSHRNCLLLRCPIRAFGAHFMYFAGTASQRARDGIG
jgi:hypothetical protein